MPNVKNTILDTLLSLVAPHLCSGCGKIGNTFCDNCKYNINQEPFFGCILCGVPNNQGICYSHKVKFQQAFVVGERSGPLQRLIGGFKFRNIKQSSTPLAQLLCARLPITDKLTTVLIPVPSTPAHIRERGYDHMLLITNELSRLTRHPVEQLLVRRTMSVQHKANRKDRFLQAKVAFEVCGKIDSSCVYILVDDIVTTGATIGRAAELLAEAGATSVWIAVVARQPLD